MLSKKKLLGEYLIGKTIGTGAFSKVKIGFHKATNQKVAIKVIDKKLIKEKAEQAKQAQEEREKRKQKKEGFKKEVKKESTPLTKSDAPSFISELQLEVQLLMRLDHPNIIRLYQVMDTDDECYVVMEYAAGGELLDHITSRGRLSEAEARKYFRQLISAMDHCHLANVVHRDLKLENLLLNSENNLLLSDFGLGRTFRSDEEELMKTFCGTPNYAAVELISGIPYVGVKSDIWAMGIVLFIMTTGHPPFSGQNISALYSKIKAVDYKCPEYFSKDLIKVIARMLTKDPHKRIGMDELRQDPWVNFEEIERPLRIEPKILGNPDPSQISQFIVGITNNKDAIIYTLHTHVETRGSLNPAANIPASSTPSRQSAVGRRASMLIRHPEGGPSQQRGGGGGGEEDDVSPLPIDLSGAFAAKSGHRSSVSDSNAPIRRRSTISSASDASATLGVNLGSLPLTLAPISHTPSPIPDNTKDNNDVLINAPKPRMRSMSVGQRPHSIALSSDMDVKKVLAPINPTAERDTKLMRRMSMVGPSIPPIDPTEIQHQEPGGHKPGSFTLNRRASMVVPAVSRPTDLSGTAVPAPGVLMRTPSSIVDDLDPFSTDDFAFDLEPTKEEIEDWHGFHRPAKEVRTVRFSFSSNTTSSLQPALIFQEIHRVLVDLQVQKYHTLKMKRVDDYYMMQCSITADGDIEAVAFEIEVCKVWLLKIHGIRVKRISGNPFTYKSIYQEMIDAIQIK